MGLVAFVWGLGQSAWCAPCPRGNMHPPGLHLRQCNAALRPLNFGSDASWRASEDGAIPAEVQAFKCSIRQTPLGRDQDEGLLLPWPPWAKILFPLPKQRQKQKQRWAGLPSNMSLCELHTQRAGKRPGGGLDIGRYVPPWLLPSLRTSVTTEAARLWPMLRRQEQERVGTYSISSDELHLDQTKYLVVDGLYCLGHNGHTSSQYFPNRPSPSDSVVPVILPHTADKE